MTCSTSVVAVCRSRASLVSLNSRTFWIAITAWSAKVCSSSIWWSLNAPGSLRVTLIVPVATPSCSIGTIRMHRKPRRRATSRMAAADSGSASVSATDTGAAVRAALECATGIGKACLSASLPASSVLDSATRCNSSPTTRATAVEKPPSRRLALLAMASNTGCTSDGELAITFRISAVAVWRSSASRVSLNSRTFSIAITAWSAKVFSRSVWRFGVWPGSVQPTRIAPTARRR